MADKLLSQHMSDFHTKYHVTVNFNAMERFSGKFKYLDNFLFEKKEAHPERKQFMSGLLYLLHAHIQHEIKMTRGASYDLSKLNFVDFLVDYEDMMAQKHVEQGTGTRERFEGIKPGKVFSDALRATEIFNKSLGEIWAHNIRKGTLELSDMKACTRGIRDDFNTKNALVTEKDKADLANVVLAQQAMERACQARTWLWRIFNFVTLIQENLYLSELNEQIRFYRETKHFPVDTIAEKYSASMINEARETSKVYAKERTAQNKALEEQAQIRAQNSVETKVAAVAAEPDFAKTFSSDIVDALPQSSQNKSLQKSMLQSVFKEHFVDTIQKHNKNFGNAEEDPGECVLSGFKAVFKRSYIMAETLGYRNPAERLVAAQIMADKVMTKLSPAAYDDKYAEFANGYAMKNTEECKDALGSMFEKGNLSETELFEAANKGYSDWQREGINVEEAGVSKLNTETVPQVKQEPQISAPVPNPNK